MISFICIPLNAEFGILSSRGGSFLFLVSNILIPREPSDSDVPGDIYNVSFEPSVSRIVHVI